MDELTRLRQRVADLEARLAVAEAPSTDTSGEWLRASEDALRSFHANSLFLMGVVELPPDDADIIHVYDSPATDRFFGNAPGSTVGRSARDMGVPEAIRRMWIERYRESERTGEPVRFEYQHGTPDAGVWLRSVVSCIGPVSGGRVRFSYVTEDVTHRKAAQDAVRESEQRLTMALHAGRLGFWDWNVQTGDVVFGGMWTEMLGYAQAEIEPHLRSWERLLHPEDVPHVTAALEAHLEGRTPFYESEHRLLHRDGTWRWILDRGQVVERDREGRPLRALGTHADISGQKAAEEALQEADRRKDEFLAMLAHELRNPLAPIRTAVGIIASNTTRDPLLLRCAEIVERQTAQMVRLLDDLLDISRLSRGRLALRRAPTSLGDVLDAAIESTAPLIDAAHQRIEVTGSAGAIEVDGDVARLTQVLTNLLNNASKYSPPGSRIEVGVTATAADTVVSVRDHGIGIPAPMLGRVFDLFVQVPEARQHAPGGLGIGLSLARQLVEMHGGRIEAASEGPGRGSTFRITLPRRQRAVSPSDGRAVRHTAFRGRVLIADDNADAADTLALFLGQVGSEVRTVYDGDAAVREAATFEPDVVLLDLGMPGRDGYETCRALRASARGAQMQIVAITGWGQAEDRQRSLEAGFDLHLVKPVSPEALLASLERGRAGSQASSGSAPAR